MRALGIDTSNYTCSAALYDSITGEVFIKKRLLPHPKGAIGLRQSQAVFEHVKCLGDIIEELFLKTNASFDVVGVSNKPRTVEGSYMPCFLVGEMTAKSICASNCKKLYKYSHQQGHIAAALYSANKLSWLKEGRFIAFHVSGGTTECLLIRCCNNKICDITKLGGTLDLNAGQVIDRVGSKLGLDFPAGSELEKLALKCNACEMDIIKFKTAVKNMDCCLSGLENKCSALLSFGHSKEYVARYCLTCIGYSLCDIFESVYLNFGELPVLFAGGVMRNSIIKTMLSKKYNTFFAEPEYSSDNALGPAILACLEEL